MARSQISSSGKDIFTDDGAVLLSLINGEQTHLSITANWMISMVGCTIIAKVVEALNIGDGAKPDSVRAGGVVTILPIIDVITADNIFVMVLPQSLSSTWAIKATPNKPVYGFIDLEIADSGGGSSQQVYKPISGLIEISYSPTEG